MVREESRDTLADELTVVRCQLGERDAFDTLIRRWSEPLYRHACRLSDDPDRASDLTQDIWVRVLRAIGELRDPARFRPWLFGIAHRAFIDTLRVRYSERDRLELDPDELHADTFDDENLTQALHAHLAQLPSIEREALLLFYLQDLSQEEISTALEIPIGTVKSRLHRARRLLRALMNPTEQTK